MKNVIVIHYAGEITLKGANRSWFEGLLMKNIRNAVPAEKIIKNQSRIIIGLGENSDSKKILENLSRVFGISWYATAIQTDCTLEKIGEVVLALTRSWPRIPIRVETKRADKSFPLTSMQVNEKIGRQLKENGFPIDLTSPEKTVYIEILGDRALVFTNRQKAWDGMPVGSAG
ncbi:MAG TPA: THUMP domain-containing protein, partial [Candidatus Bilamarchaeaceae archaeon]|nr:THUMP domain-containing protein [Candidatus Bilamarchaeaceae archaeon]